MNIMVEWYILHVNEEKERKVAEILNRKLSPKLYRPFIPQKEKFFRRAGVTSIIKAPCFPGYVFIESQTTADEFLDGAKRLIWSIKEVHSLLSYDGKDDIAMADIGLLKQLMGGGDCITVSSGNIVDGCAKIESGALVGMESLIVSVNRNRKIAEIEFKLMGETKRIMVGLEIISKS